MNYLLFLSRSVGWNSLRFYLIVLGLAPFCLFAAGGSGSDPILEEAISVTLYVDAGAASGGNGSLGSPYSDLQEAFNRAVYHHNAQGEGVRVLLAPGQYRSGEPGALNALIFPSPYTDAPVVIEGAGWSPGHHTGDVILTGSEVWTDWQADGDGTWWKPWPYAWGIGPNNTGGGNPPEPMLRYELVHVNGATFYQVTGPTDPHLNNLNTEEGAFWVDESIGRITLRPPAEFGDVNQALVEVSTRRRLLHHWRPQAQTTPTNVAFRNLVFQHGTGGLNSGAVMLQNMIGLWVEDCVFQNNKQMGVTISGRHNVFTIRNTDVVANGEMGAGFMGVNVRVEHSRFNGNSRFADVVEYYGWGYGGVKVGTSSDFTFSECEFSNNYGMGLWFDTGCVRTLVENCILVDNTSQGLWSENNNRNNVSGLGLQPTVTVRNSYIAGNYRRSPQANVLGGGFYITESENTVIEDSVLYGNHIQFRVSDGPRRGPIANTTVRYSILAGHRETPQNIYAIGYGTTGWPEFFNTLSDRFDHNVYYFPGITEDGVVESPQPRPDTTIAFYRLNQAMLENLAGWKALHVSKGAEQHSTWITDYEGQALVTVVAAAEYRQETGGAVDGFVVRRATRDPSVPIVVHYSVTGTAIPGENYVPFSGTVTIPAGAFSAVIPFEPLQTGASFGDRTVGVQISASSAYATTRNTATFILEDQDISGLPRVSVAATTPTAFEDGETPGVFTLYRTGSTDEALTVFFRLEGTAAATRYQAPAQSPGGEVTFPVGSSTTEVLIIPVDDDIPQLNETVVFVLEEGAGYTPSLEAPVSATITLLDNDVVRPVTATMQPSDDPLQAVIHLHNPDPFQSQTFTLTFPSGEGYTWQDSTQPAGPEFVWVELNNGANGSVRLTALGGITNAISHAIQIGFEFPFFGDGFNQLHVASDGILFFGSNVPGMYPHNWGNHLLPSTQLALNREDLKALVLFWSNLVEGAQQIWNSSTSSWEPNPHAGSSWIARPDEDTFIFQYENFSHYTNYPERKVTMQVTLRSSGEIFIAYKDFDIPYQFGATIGVQDKGLDQPESLTIAHNTDYVQPGMAIRIRPAVPWFLAAEQIVQVTVPPGGSQSVSVTLDPGGLAYDSYTTHLTVTSDHPDQPSLSVPVTLVVTDAVDAPSTPAQVTAQALSYASILLEWEDVAHNETGYRIERALDAAGPYVSVAELPANSVSFLDEDVQDGVMYFYRVLAFNLGGDSEPSDVVSATTPSLGAPPMILNADGFNPQTDEAFQFVIRTDREIFSSFEANQGSDAGLGSAGAGWENAWTVYATAWETSTQTEIAVDAPLFPGWGKSLRFSGTATGSGKRTFIGRSYVDDIARRVALDQSHRLVIHMRVDDIESFLSTGDRIYLWDRPEPANSTHNDVNMTWGFMTAGTVKAWRYYGSSLLETGIALSEGHTYRFVIDIDPPMNRWRFRLTDLTGGTHFVTADWVPFRNAAENPQQVGGHLHAGMYLETAPQTATISLDEIRVTPLDLTFSAESLPDSLVLDENAGILAGSVIGVGSFPVSVQDAQGQTTVYFYFGEGFTDSNGSGADDEWEMAAFGNLDGTDVEIDGRFYSRRTLYFWNLMESTGQVFEMDGFRFGTVPDRNYQVEHRESLTEGDWAPFGTLVAGDGEEAQISNPQPGFYRVRVLLP